MLASAMPKRSESEYIYNFFLFRFFLYKKTKLFCLKIYWQKKKPFFFLFLLLYNILELQNSRKKCRKKKLNKK